MDRLVTWESTAAFPYLESNRRAETMSARSFIALGVICLGAFSLAAFPNRVHDKELNPSELPVVEHGIASYYGDQFQGRTTASGDVHDQNELSAASRDLPLGSKARVTNLENGKSVEVEINDRGPYAHG